MDVPVPGFGGLFTHGFHCMVIGYVYQQYIWWWDISGEQELAFSGSFVWLVAKLVTYLLTYTYPADYQKNSILLTPVSKISAFCFYSNTSLVGSSGYDVFEPGAAGATHTKERPNNNNNNKDRQ